LFRHSLKPHTNLGILRLGRIHSYKNNNKPSIGNIFNNNSRKFHNNRTCLSLGKSKNKYIHIYISNSF
ncbi:hypothetical protein GLOIN_2v1578577, partial [Rhizophagus irregularis DAOM 181602=DAOM 197198]